MFQQYLPDRKPTAAARISVITAPWGLQNGTDGNRVVQSVQYVSNMKLILDNIAFLLR
jgi:alpha/beta superfamily hydrolase